MDDDDLNLFIRGRGVKTDTDYIENPPEANPALGDDVAQESRAELRNQVDDQNEAETKTDPSSSARINQSSETKENVTQAVGTPVSLIEESLQDTDEEERIEIQKEKGKRKLSSEEEESDNVTNKKQHIESSSAVSQVGLCGEGGGGCSGYIPLWKHIQQSMRRQIERMNQNPSPAPRSSVPHPQFQLGEVGQGDQYPQGPLGGQMQVIPPGGEEPVIHQQPQDIMRSQPNQQHSSGYGSPADQNQQTQGQGSNTGQRFNQEDGTRFPPN